MPANGSSSRMKRGCVASARAISTRRRSPPDSAGAGEARSFSIDRSRSRPLEHLVDRRASSAAGRRRRPAARGRRGCSPRRRACERSTAPAAGTTGPGASAGGSACARPRWPVDRDLAAVGAHQADDHVEAGRLAGAVRAEQADHLAALDRRGARRRRRCASRTTCAGRALRAGAAPASMPARRRHRFVPERRRDAQLGRRARRGAGAARAASAAAALPSLRRQHGADAAARVGRRRRRAAGDVEDLGRAVVGDEVAGDLVGCVSLPRRRRTEALLTKRMTSDLPSYSRRSASPAMYSSGASRFCRKVACWRRRAEGDRGVIAVGQLAHLDARRPDRHRPLGDDDVAVEDDELVEQVDPAGQVGLDVERLEAVGLFGLRRQRARSERGPQERGRRCGERRSHGKKGSGHGENGVPHSGMKLAGHSMPRTAAHAA